MKSFAWTCFNLCVFLALNSQIRDCVEVDACHLCLYSLLVNMQNPMDACDLCKHVIGGLGQTFVSFLMEHISIRIGVL